MVASFRKFWMPPRAPAPPSSLIDWGDWDKPLLDPSWPLPPPDAFALSVLDALDWVNAARPMARKIYWMQADAVLPVARPAVFSLVRRLLALGLIEHRFGMIAQRATWAMQRTEAPPSLLDAVVL